MIAELRAKVLAVIGWRHPTPAAGQEASDPEAIPGDLERGARDLVRWRRRHRQVMSSADRAVARAFRAAEHASRQ